MSPFREAPAIELGPLTVGLAEAAEKAMGGVPRGGRLLALGVEPGSPRATGTLGSVGLVAFGVVAFVGWTTHWAPHSVLDLALIGAGLGFGGLSLAAVLRASDREGARVTRPGEAVHRSARDVLAELYRFARLAERAAPSLGARRLDALARALAAAAAPDVAPWIPADVRGRAALLLGRASAATGGPGWGQNATLRAEVRALLVTATEHLDDPEPAEHDLAAIDDHTAGALLRIAASPIAAPDEHDDDDPSTEPAPRSRCNAEPRLR